MENTQNYFAEWSESLVSTSRRSNNTRKNYETEVRGFLNFHGEIGRKVLPMHVNRYFAQKVNSVTGERMSDNSVATALCGIKSFLAWMQENELTDAAGVIAMKGPKVKVKEIVPPETKNIEALMETDSDDWKDKMLAALVSMSYYSGVRVSELLSMKMSDIDGKIIHIRAGKGKKERTVPFHNQHQREMLFEYRASLPDEFAEIDDMFISVRGRVLPEITYRKYLDERCAELGIEERITPHDFRRAFATDGIENGGNIKLISKAMGHSKMTTTARYIGLRNNNSYEGRIGL